VNTPTLNQKLSEDWFQRLGFQKVEHPDLILYTDGQIIVEINLAKFARPGLKIYNSDWDETIKKLEKETKVITIEDHYLFSDPSGSWIYLIHDTPTITVEKKKCFSTLGNFAGLSLEVIDMNKSLRIWEILGYTVDSGSVEQGWLSMKNEEGFSISLMKPNCCPHIFYNPSLTYFNGGKNLPVIQGIRDAGIDIKEEITTFNKEGIVDNVILQEPGGYGFFIFND